MKAQGVAWILMGSLFMFGCGSDAGGPGSAALSAAEIGACTGEGCPGECRRVSIKTALGSSVALCDDAESAKDGSGASNHEDPPLVGVGRETLPDAGVDHLDDDHVSDAHDAGPVIDHTADAGSGHAADAGSDAGHAMDASSDSGHAADAGSGAGHEADAGSGAGHDAGADCAP